MPSKRTIQANSRRKRGRKKIIVLIVEGPSDLAALVEPLANTIYACDPEVVIYPRCIDERSASPDHRRDMGDITSKEGVNPDTIEHVIDKLYLHPFFDEEPYYPKDVTRIVHVVDTDGAFIPETRVIAGPKDAASNEYRNDCIMARNVEDILARNARKSANMRHLAAIRTIKTGYDKKKRSMPYSVYFFSSNLDHYLHGDANLDRNKKILLASEFARKCSWRPSLFYDTIQGDVEYYKCGYEESWDRIQVGCNSLERHTNIGLLIDEFHNLSSG